MKRMSLAFFVLAGCANPTAGYRPSIPPTTTQADANPKTDDADVVAKREAAPERPNPDQMGMATWYGGAFAGHKTANGEIFDPAKLTAAHRKLPFGTWVEVKRVDTGRTVRVRINDRGPWGDDKRIIDVSRKAAEDL